MRCQPGNHSLNMDKLFGMNENDNKCGSEATLPTAPLAPEAICKQHTDSQR